MTEVSHRAYVNDAKHATAAVGSFDWAYYCTKAEFEWWLRWTEEYWLLVEEPPFFGAYDRMLMKTAELAKQRSTVEDKGCPGCADCGKTHPKWPDYCHPCEGPMLPW